MMSQDTSEGELAAVLQESLDLLERHPDDALGGPDSRMSRIFKSWTDEELITLLKAGWSRDDRGPEAEAADIRDEKFREHK